MKNKNIYLCWYYDVIDRGVDTINIDIKNKKEILELQNFFLFVSVLIKKGLNINLIRT